MQSVAKILLHDSEGKILVLRRSSTHPRYAFHLDFPGGEIDDGESPHLGVVREVLEETGLIITPDDVEYAHERIHDNRIIYMVYTGRISATQPIPEISWEHDQYEWLTREELINRALPEGVDSYYQMVIEYLNTQS